ncbi:MAG: hypothetical protein ACETWT_14975 [Thermodesulfobacteriota bacterium]
MSYFISHEEIQLKMTRKGIGNPHARDLTFGELPSPEGISWRGNVR